MYGSKGICIEGCNRSRAYNGVTVSLKLMQWTYPPQARKDSVIAELKWFYRVSELPEATYSLLMDDRKKSKHIMHSVILVSHSTSFKLAWLLSYAIS